MSLFQENPVLIKEIRGRLRARRQSRGSRITGMIVTALVVFLMYFYGIQGLITGSSRSNGETLFAIYMVGIQLTIALFTVPSVAASSITQEREQQTWNALLLSRLTGWEIVFGKFVAAVLPTMLLLALFFPLCLFAAFLGDIGIARYVLANSVLLVTVVFFTAVGLYWSWACRRTFVATAATFGTILFFTLGTLLIWTMMMTASMGSSSGRPEEYLVNWIDPYIVMGVALDSQAKNYPIPIAYCLVFTVAAGFLLYFLSRRLPFGAKELEQ